MELKCVIIDDEPLARECISGYIADVNFLSLAGVASNPLELTDLLNANPVDLIFLDIQMPVMNGIDFLKTRKNIPMVIITTAYPSYALESYQLDVMDYLVKPITFNRFFMAINKAKDYHELLVRSRSHETPESPPPSDYFFVKCGHRFERIYFSDVLFIEALQNYVTIHTSKGKFITLLNLKSVEEHLDASSFIRIHKSYIVSIPKIDRIENNEVVIGASRISISRLYRDQILEKVVNERLWKR